MNLGKAKVDPFIGHQARPSYLGEALPYHTIHDHAAAATIDLEAEIQNQPDLGLRQHIHAHEPYVSEVREPRRRGTDRL